MGALECNVCHFYLDEEEHQPRHLGCSHDACTTCIKELIKKGSFECPLCRRVIKANKAEDLPINHGVVQVLRVFKGFMLTDNKLNKGTKNIKEFCSIHKCVADKRCFTCKVWICVQCKEFHNLNIGCKIQEYNQSLQNVKKDHQEQIEPTLSSIRNNLRSLSTKLSEIERKKKRLEEELEENDNLYKKMQTAVEHGTKVLNEIETTTAKLNEATTSKELNERVHIANEWHQFAKIWCKRNTSSLLEVDNEGRYNCDCCNVTIWGPRYECLVCDDYDLCKKCEKMMNHTQHPMLRIPSSQSKLDGVNEGEIDCENIYDPDFTHNGITCDSCDGGMVFGYRYKCLICFDYDLCVTCEHAGKHNQHIFIRLVG